MTSKEDVGPAYPVPDVKTLRDEFAMAALQGILAGRWTGNPDDFALTAYAHADAMLKERTK